VQFTLETEVAAALADVEAVGVADGVDGLAAGVAGAVVLVELSALIGVSEGAGVLEGAATGVSLLVKAPDPTRIAVVPMRTRTSSVAIKPGVRGPFFFWVGATRGVRGGRVLPPLR